MGHFIRRARYHLEVIWPFGLLLAVAAIIFVVVF